MSVFFFLKDMFLEVELSGVNVWIFKFKKVKRNLDNDPVLYFIEKIGATRIKF